MPKGSSSLRRDGCHDVDSESPLGRALLVEASLLAAGLAFAKALAGSSVSSVALAVWGFFLVQSLFFLAGGTAARPEEEFAEDPFDRARREAVRLMEEASM